MGNPELISDLILKKYPNLENKIEEEKNLNERFAIIVRGYERFNLQDFFSRYKYYFETILQDTFKCIQCDGNCKSSQYVNGGTAMYQGIDFNYLTIYNRPAFIAVVCPGVAERKKEIKEQLTSGKTTITDQSNEIPNQNTGEQFAKCKEKLLKSNVVSLDKKRQEKEQN